MTPRWRRERRHRGCLCSQTRASAKLTSFVTRHQGDVRRATAPARSPEIQRPSADPATPVAARSSGVHRRAAHGFSPRKLTSRRSMKIGMRARQSSTVSAWGRRSGIRSITATLDRAVLLANVHVSGVSRSTDGGVTWQPSIDVDSDVHEVRAHPPAPWTRRMRSPED